MWQENAEETESQDLWNHHQACGAVWSRSIDANKEGEAFINNRNENVEPDQGCDTKG